MVIAFAGHAHVSSHSRVKELVKKQIRNIVDEDDYIVFYLGGCGEFDNICASVCTELKAEYDKIETVYVTPYINMTEQRKIKEMMEQGMCDGSIYPSIENVPLRYAILKRNEWMMKNADMIIAYVNHSYGGAYKSLQVASRRKKKIINICDLLIE